MHALVRDCAVRFQRLTELLERLGRSPAGSRRTPCRAARAPATRPSRGLRADRSTPSTAARPSTRRSASACSACRASTAPTNASARIGRRNPRCTMPSAAHARSARCSATGCARMPALRTSSSAVIGPVAQRIGHVEPHDLGEDLRRPRAEQHLEQDGVRRFLVRALAQLRVLCCYCTNSRLCHDSQHRSQRARPADARL